MPVVTTLNFCGQTEEAVRFYGDVLNADLRFLMRFREAPNPFRRTGELAEKVFHATFVIQGTELMASDVGCEEPEAVLNFAGFALALRFESIDVARPVFDCLNEGGRVLVPLSEASFTGWYGVVADRFGLTWKINVSSDPSTEPS